MKTIVEPQKEIPVIQEADVCVLGGSCTGVFAAVRAARLGAKVVLVEQQNGFGGVAVGGLVNIWHSLYDTEHRTQIIAGLTSEVLERLERVNALHSEEGKRPVNDFNAYNFNSYELKIELDKLVLEHNIIPYLHTKYCAPLVEGDTLRAIFVENKNGRGAICAKVFIDASGDGDLCRSCGAEYYAYRYLQPPTACANIYGFNKTQGFSIQQAIYEHREEYGLREDWGWNTFLPNTGDITMHAETHVFDVNCADADMLTYSEMEGRRQIRAYMDMIRKYAPNGDQVCLASLCSYIGIRQSYQIKSLYQCKTDDILNGKKFEDAILNGTYGTDVHHNSDQEPGSTHRFMDGEERIHHGCNRPGEIRRWRPETETNPTFYQLPYRSIVPDKLDNLLMCGRMIDAEEEAYGAIRVMVSANQMGEAAGVAAYLALSEGCPVRDVDVQRLRRLLKEGGSAVI